MARMAEASFSFCCSLESSETTRLILYPRRTVVCPLGFSKVMVICLDEERLRKIGNAVSGSLGSELAARVEYFQPDQFVAYLKTIPSENPKGQTTVRLCGYGSQHRLKAAQRSFCGGASRKAHT